MFRRQFLIKNLDDLEQLAKWLIPYLKPNIFLLLSGDLGVGKTTLTKLIAKHLGIIQEVTSPTFIILQRYQIINYYLNHFDFFRLSSEDNLKIFADLVIDNLNIIEWPEKNPQFWHDEEKIFIKFYWKLSTNERLIRLELKK